MRGRETLIIPTGGNQEGERTAGRDLSTPRDFALYCWSRARKEIRGRRIEEERLSWFRLIESGESPEKNFFFGERPTHPGGDQKVALAGARRRRRRRRRKRKEWEQRNEQAC